MYYPYYRINITLWTWLLRSTSGQSVKKKIDRQTAKTSRWAGMHALFTVVTSDFFA